MYGLVTVTTLYHKAESNKPTTTLAARETLLIKPIMKNCVCLFFMQIIVILLRTFLMDRQSFFPPVVLVLNFMAIILAVAEQKTLDLLLYKCLSN